MARIMLLAAELLFFHCKGQKLILLVLLYPVVTRLKITGFDNF